MSVFISYSHQTGTGVAREIAAALRARNLDPWWFLRQLNPEQVDPMVEFALANCNRCIFAWTQEKPSNWTFCELMSIRNYFSRRLPNHEATEAFVIVRDLAKIRPNARLPLFSECQYVNFKAGSPLDFGFLDDSVPGVTPLVAGGTLHPRLDLDRRRRLHIGKRVLHGAIHGNGKLEFDERFCWVLLEDKHDNWYVQQPRPTFTHARRWGGAVVNLGMDMRAILLIAADAVAHEHIVTRVLQQSFSGQPRGKWPGKYCVLDRVDFDPLTQ